MLEKTSVAFARCPLGVKIASGWLRSTVFETVSDYEAYRMSVTNSHLQTVYYCLEVEA